MEEFSIKRLTDEIDRLRAEVERLNSSALRDRARAQPDQTEYWNRLAREARDDVFSAKFDCHYDGDINRCDKDCKQLGQCKRRTSGHAAPQAVSKENGSAVVGQTPAGAASVHTDKPCAACDRVSKFEDCRESPCPMMSVAPSAGEGRMVGGFCQDRERCLRDIGERDVQIAALTAAINAMNVAPVRSVGPKADRHDYVPGCQHDWPGPGPQPASFMCKCGTKVYRSYEDYCDD